jgi:hypothetical protein
MANHLSRRKLVQVAAVTASSLIIARVSHAQQPILSEDDATAVAMGYKADHTTVDTAAWPKKAGPGGAEQQCTNCTLYQKLDEDYGLCPIFSGKRVHANGWCNGWVA